MSDAGAISYLNRMTVHIIGVESLTTQLSELSTPPHHPEWARAGACARGAPVVPARGAYNTKPMGYKQDECCSCYQLGNSVQSSPNIHASQPSWHMLAYV